MDQTASKKSATMDKTTLKKCILAIDLGSTALRAAFVECEAPYTYHPIQNRDAQANKDAGATVTCMGDFPVSCCPLDPNDPFARIGADAASEPGHVSAKYLMYILANVDDSVMADYPLPTDLMALKEDAQLREDCRTILAMLFGRLRERVDDYTKRKDLFFDEIILTIPSQWDARFEAVYESIIKEAFAYENEEGAKVKKDVHFCGEADALARYIILHEERELEDWEVVLFLDFGGHSMSFATMELKRTKSTGGSGNSSMTFLELDSGGCAGGSEMWSHQVGLLISEKLEETEVADADERKKFKLLSDFNTKKIGFMDQIMAGGVLPLVCWDEHATLTTINLPHEEIKRCFDTALERPFAMAKEQLRKLKGYSGDKKIGVVVAGGTLKSITAREAVFADCDIPENRIKYTTEIDVTWLSSCNCHGAALAHAKKMTVAQFFEQGAVIALQQKGPERNAEWEGFAYLLVGNDKKYVASVYNRHTGAEFKLVCNPNYAQEVTADKNKQDNAGEAGASAGSVTNAPDNSDSDPNTNVLIPIGECYDLRQLGPQLAGRLIIEASLTSPSGTASSERTLNVSISRKSQRAAPKDKVIDLPLFLDPGHNAVHVDVDALGPEASNQQAALRQREEEESQPERAVSELPEPAQPERETTEAPSEEGSGSRRSSHNKSATAKASGTKRKRKDTNAAPAQPSKRPRTRAALGSDHELQQLPYYAPPVPRKRKATAPASSTATKKARIATLAPQPNTNNNPDNQSDQDLQGQLHEQLRWRQIEEQPQEQPSTQDVSQHNDEDTHVYIDDQLDNELDQNHEPAATASGNHTQPPPPPLSPERNSSNNLNVNGNTSRSTRNRTAVNARGPTRAKSHTPSHADRPAATYTNGRFAPRSSPPKSRRHRTEPLPGQRGQPQPRRSTRQQKGKSPVAASPAATRQQQQQPQQGQEDLQPQTRPQPQPAPPHPEQEARPQAEPQAQAQAQAQAQNEAVDSTPAANLNTLEQLAAVATAALDYEETHPQPRPSPTRIRQPAPPEAPRRTREQLAEAETQARHQRWRKAVEGNREDEGEILDSITVNPDPNRPLADQVVDEDETEEDKEDEGDEDGDDGEDDGGDDGDGDDGDGDDGDGDDGDGDDGDGDDDGLGPGDLGLGRLFSSSQEQEKEKQGGSSSPVLGEQGESSSRGRGSGNSGGRSSGSGRGQGGEEEVDGNVDEQVQLPGPLRISRLQRTLQIEARASTSPQKARGGNRVVGAAERNKENQRQQTTGTVAVAVAGTGEETRPRPSREEKGKGKEVVKPAPKPAPAPASRPRPRPTPTPTPTLAPRAFYGQPSSAAASSSSSASAIPNAAPPPKTKADKNKGKGKAKEPILPATTTTTTTPAPAAPSSSDSTIPDILPPPKKKGKGKAKAKETAAATTTPAPLAPLAPLAPTSSTVPPYPRLLRLAHNPTAKGKGKAKAKEAITSLFAPRSPSALAALIESTAPRAPPIPPRPESSSAQPTDTGIGTDDVVVKSTTPIPLPGYARASRAGRGVDGDGTEVDGGREGVVDGDGDGDSVEYGSRVLRSGMEATGKGKEVNQTVGESSRSGRGSNAANATPTRKRARIGIEDLLSSPVESRPQSQPRPQARPQHQPQPQPHLLPQPQEEDNSSPARKRQRTGGGGAGGGGESSNAKKKRKRS